MMEKSTLKENAVHGTSAFPFATYEWKGGYVYPVPLHWHSETEIIYLKEGSFRVGIHMKEYRIEAPALLFIGAEEVHSIELPQEGEESAVVFQLSMLSFEELDGIQYKIIRPLLEKKTVFPGILTGQDTVWENVLYLYEQIFQAAEGKTLGSFLKVKAGLYELLACLYEQGYLTEVEEVGAADVYRIDTLKQVLSYIQQNLGSRITIADTAKAAGMNPQYFCRYFKKHTGKTVTEYINELRINEAAKELLKGDDKIIEIAGRCGYDNMGYFIKRFTKNKGMTPSEYRKNNKEKSI